MKVSKGQSQPKNCCGRLLNSLHGSGFTSLIPGFECGSHQGVKRRLSLTLVQGLRQRVRQWLNMSVAQKPGTQNGALVSGNMDQNLRTPPLEAVKGLTPIRPPGNGPCSNDVPAPSEVEILRGDLRISAEPLEWTFLRPTQISRDPLAQKASGTPHITRAWNCLSGGANPTSQRTRPRYCRLCNLNLSLSMLRKVLTCPKQRDPS